MNIEEINPLNKNQIDFWNKNSYLHLPGLFDSEIEDLSNWAHEIGKWEESVDRWMSFFEMDNPNQLSRIENFTPYHIGFKEFFNSEKILLMMKELMKEEAVLYKERINFKLPGGGPHAAHQDGVAYEQGENATFNVSTKPYISILISIDEATAKNGCLEVVPNWSLDNLTVLDMEAPLKESPNYKKIKQSIEDDLPWIMVPTMPGDAIVFTERLPHRSKPNYSEKTRRIIYGVYNPSSHGDQREKYFFEKKNNPNDARYMVGNPHALSK